jgi:hypothetical protein
LGLRRFEVRRFWELRRFLGLKIFRKYLQAGIVRCHSGGVKRFSLEDIFRRMSSSWNR